MTEKRFKLDSEVGFIDTQKCGGDTMTLFEVVVELNKLNDENNQLKEDLEEYCNFSLHDVLDKKNKEIEQLKQQLSDDFNQSNCITVQKSIINDLKKENEQLKVELNKLEEDLDYYKTKCASLETGLLQAQRDVEWLRDNTVWEQMPSKRTVTKTFK